MWRVIRICLAAIPVLVAMTAIHAALGLGPEMARSGWAGLADLALLGGGMILVALSDREFFGLK